jgi:tetratricopeptide (TPR) repeat protein
VRHVLEGSVRRNGDNVRVTVQLIDTASGYHVWAGNFDRAWRDVLELQDDIAISVTDALQVVLKEKDLRPGDEKPHQIDTRAIDPYLAGLAALRQPGDLSRLRHAETSFKAAIDIDPEFAGAYAGLCRTYARQFERTHDPAPLSAADSVCRKSLELDSSLVETEKALASMAVVAGKFDAAAEAYRALLARNPQDADAHVGLGAALEGLGRYAEAEAAYRQAIAVEPAYWGAYSALAAYLFPRGKIDEATIALRKVTELVPSSANAWSNLGGALQMAGNLSDAMQAYDRSLRIEPSKDAYSNLATSYFYLGRFPEAVANYERAAALGEHDHVIQGNLGDALWQIDGRRNDAIARYRRAILLAEAALEATPADASLRAQLGYYYGRVGDRDQSRRYLSDALAAGPEMLYVQYFVGVAAADRGDRTAALRAVAELVRLGYPSSQLRSAPEFRSLLHDPEYRKVIESG